MKTRARGRKEQEGAGAGGSRREQEGAGGSRREQEGAGGKRREDERDLLPVISRTEKASTAGKNWAIWVTPS